MFYHILTKDPEKDAYIVYLCGPDVNVSSDKVVVEAADAIFVAFDDSLVVVVEVVKVLVDVIPVVEVSTNNVNNTMMISQV